MKIAAKLSITVLFLAVLLAVTSSILIYTFTRNTLQQSISVNQLQIATETMARIDRVVYERYLNIQDLASSIIIENYIANKATKEDVDNRMRSFFNTSGPWDITKIVDINGNIIFSSQENLVDKQVNNIPNAFLAFTESMKGEVYVSDLVISEDTGRPTIFFSAPVKQTKSAGKPIIGVAIGQFSWPAIEEIIRSSHDKSTKINLFSKDELLLASNDQSLKLFSKEVEAPNEIIKEGEEFSGVIGDILATQVPQIGYLDYKGKNWELIFQQPTSIIFASALQNANKIIIMYIPIIIISFLILIFLINQLFIRPLKKLVTVTQSIANGNTEKRVSVKTKDEVGILGISINEMTDKLLNTQSNIEKKVAERTAEIERINQHMVNRELKMIELKQKIKDLEKTNHES